MRAESARKDDLSASAAASVNGTAERKKNGENFSFFSSRKFRHVIFSSMSHRIIFLLLPGSSPADDAETEALLKAALFAAGDCGAVGLGDASSEGASASSVGGSASSAATLGASAASAGAEAPTITPDESSRDEVSIFCSLLYLFFSFFPVFMSDFQGF